MLLVTTEAVKRNLSNRTQSEKPQAEKDHTNKDLHLFNISGAPLTPSEGLSGFKLNY